MVQTHRHHPRQHFKTVGLIHSQPLLPTCQLERIFEPWKYYAPFYWHNHRDVTSHAVGLHHCKDNREEILKTTDSPVIETYGLY